MRASIVIRGNRECAALELRERGIANIERITLCSGDLPECVCLVNGVSADLLNRWYVETRRPPFPNGSLLLWSQVPEDAPLSALAFLEA